MSGKTLTDKYFDALASADGPGAAALFAPDGTLDDLRGGHHHGTEEIASFIANRPDLTVEVLSDAHREGPRLTVYGRIHYGSGEEANVRWLFTQIGGVFNHLCNSRVDRLPVDRLRPDKPSS